MNIVITDGHTLNPGDLSWECIREFGNISLYPRTAPDELYDRCSNADIIVTNKTEIRGNVIEQAHDLKLIAVTATGYNIVDIKAAREHNITVCNVPAYGTASVAQHTFALILELTNHVGVHSTSVSAGEWQITPDFGYSKTPLIELADKKLGIVGFGNIGRQVAQIGATFGMKVLYYSRHKQDTTIADYTDLKTLFTTCDIISLHCPLTEDNYQFVNDELLGLMKATAFLVNTARGQLINEQHLANALNNGRIAGAALDVLSKEPPGEDNPLLKAKNCVITPHNAWMTKEARERIMNVTIENIKSFLAGNPVNVVN
jgi:glycerate dehydrogenase